MTSDLMAELVRVTGARVERVVVTSIREKVFYAVVALAVDGHLDELDARPSDALNLAVRVGAPIFVAAEVMDQSAMLPDEVSARMDADVADVGMELPAGEWRSLSAELLGSLYRWP
jgi:bifunctional DNase/RNase